MEQDQLTERKKPVTEHTMTGRRDFSTICNSSDTVNNRHKMILHHSSSLRIKASDVGGDQKTNTIADE
jgi:hypothetical protein